MLNNRVSDYRYRSNQGRLTNNNSIGRRGNEGGMPTLYFLERATNLSASMMFAPVATNLPGQLGTTTYTDTNTIGMGPFFYRVGVGD